jgi:hypothetical protein
MRRYLIFAGSDYRPSGWGDFAGTLDTITECLRRTQDIEDKWKWVEIIDMNKEKVVVRQNKIWDNPTEEKYKIVTSFI